MLAANIRQNASKKSLLFKSNIMFVSRKRQPRRGIILLVALGLLALFGILIAAYLTFASDSRRAAFNNARRDFRGRDPETLMHEAMMQVLRGTTDPNSALFRQDLLGDYYGYHSPALGALPQEIETLAITAGNPNANPNANPTRRVLSIGGDIVKVPIRFTDRQPITAIGVPPALIPPESIPENIVNTANFTSPYNIDDSLTGRTVTLLDGPLRGFTFPIIRWKGFRDTSNAREAESRYSMFLHFDLDALPKTVILPNGQVRSLRDLLTAAIPNAAPFPFGAENLFYGLAGANDPIPMVINPMPLNGTGTGVRRTDAATETLTSADIPVLSMTPANGGVTIPVALQPNTSLWWNAIPGPKQLVGNADEPYDAPDYQNWFLSHTETRLVGGAINTRVIPSFHRPSVINYLQALLPGRDTNNDDFLRTVNMIRRATLRPIPVFDDPTDGTDEIPGLNSRFTGGNPSFALATPNRFLSSADNSRLQLLLSTLVNGPWDVDNDGDGVPDSIWIDPQLPVVTAPDGTLLRPLIAVKIEDLSARININAHGNPAQLTNAYLQALNQPLAGHLAPGSPPVALPSGRGYGPAEIFPLLTPLNGSQIDATGKVNPASQSFTTIDRLMATRYSNATGVNEIGAWTVGGAVPEWQRSPENQPGLRGFVPGQAGEEFQDRRLRPNLPRTHDRFARFGFPIDKYGRGGLALDAGGNLFSSVAGIPVLFNPNTNTSFMDEALNDPYEMDPSGQLVGDLPVRLAEFDALLNHTRWDADLHGGRLKPVLQNLVQADPSIVNIVTPYSTSDVRPTAAIAPELRNRNESRLSGTVAPPTLVEALLDRLVQVTGSPFDGPLSQADLELANSLLAPEFKLGKRMNINRPLGNGIDDNGNGVIDEPREIPDRVDDDGDGNADNPGENEELTFDGVAVRPYYSPSVTFNGNLIGETAGQALARNLYCTAMLLMNNSDAAIDRWITDTANLGNATQRREFVAHRIAQWAVNVVDYRDGDGIMTRFVYDVDLSDGWNPNFATNATQTREVWGCEHPELVFMESYAGHDLRVRDSALDSNGDTTADGDPHVDQLRMPQGSAILELYNPRPRSINANAVLDHNFEGLPYDLYDTVGNQPVLDLDRTAPGLDQNGNGNFTDAGDVPPVPVWRIAISQPHPEIIDDTNSPLRYRLQAGFPDTASFDPLVPEELGLPGAPAPLELERFVVFNNYANRAEVQTLATVYSGTNPVNASAIFSNLTNGNTNLPLGSYLTIAPRTRTHLGSVAYAAIPTGPSPQRFEVEPNRGLVHYDVAGTRTTPGVYPDDAAGDTLEPLVFIAQAFTPEVWGNLNPANRTALFGLGNQGIGFNVSEPVSGTVYYRLPEDFLLGNMGAFLLRDAYYDFIAGEGTLGGNPTPDIDDVPYDLNQNYPIGALTNTLMPGSNDPFLGTAANYCTAFLQRLADPTLPLQEDRLVPNYNPYRTVDWISMDLTVFSGEESDDAVRPGGQYANETRHRTGEARIGGASENLLFANRLNDPSLNNLPAVVMGQPYFSVNLNASVGFLNPEFGARHTFATAGNLVQYVGQPQNLPLAMHPWLNRPYASPLELMFVPACSQARLMEEFGLVNNPAAYAGTGNLAAAPTFGHLLNFLDSVDDRITGNVGSHLYRIFDYLSTGPKFRGDALPMSPATNGLMGTTTAAQQDAQEFWRQTFAFPNNYLPNYSEHGRVNLNTVGDPRVYAGLMWAHMPPASRASLGSAEWELFLRSRRGFGGPGGPLNLDPVNLNSNVPTQFGVPFTGGMGVVSSPELAGSPGLLRRPWIGGSVLRPAPNGTGQFVNDQSLYGRGTTGAHDNAERSALMRNQSMSRMENLTSTHSNSYLIRMTMGYFEAEPTNFNLGREYLSDMGRNERYKATYIIDRSIPCHYETGFDHDTERLILFRRFYKD